MQHVGFILLFHFSLHKTEIRAIQYTFYAQATLMGGHLIRHRLLGGHLYFIGIFILAEWRFMSITVLQKLCEIHRFVILLVCNKVYGRIFTFNVWIFKVWCRTFHCNWNRFISLRSVQLNLLWYYICGFDSSYSCLKYLNTVLVHVYFFTSQQYYNKENAVY